MICKNCVHHNVCSTFSGGIVREVIMGNKADKQCGLFKNKEDFVEVVRCKDCKYTVEFDKHCEINRTAYKHCSLLRGEETNNVWHKYKKYYKDYSIVELDDYCNYGERKEEL